MTDYQYSSIIEMIDIMLEGCKDIKEAREKLARLKKQPISGKEAAGQGADYVLECEA